MASSSSSSCSKKSKVETRNWLELPPEVTAAILQRLGAVEILESAQKVCTAWRKICKDPAMWRSIDMKYSGEKHNVPYDLMKMAMHAVDRSCGQLVDISLERFATDELLQYVAERASQLRCLRLVSCYDISDGGLKEAAKKLPLLEELVIIFSNIHHGEMGLANVGSSCPLLKSLTYNDEGSMSFVSDDDALAIAKTMPGLRHLQLFGNHMTNDGLQAILDGCPHLESLDLRHCFKVNLDGTLGKLCSERIKDLRLPEDSTADYGFGTSVHDDSVYPYGYDDVDPYFTDDSGDDNGYSVAEYLSLV